MTSSSENPDIKKVNVAEKLSLFSETWTPKVVGALNGQHVKVVKLSGEFVWHHHEDELVNDIAGVCSENRNVVGIMPHPERVSDDDLGSAEGLKILSSVLVGAGV